MSEEDKSKDKKDTKDQGGSPPWENPPEPEPLREGEATAGTPGKGQANKPGHSHN